MYDDLMEVLRKMALRDWHLRMTQGEADSLRSWLRMTLIDERNP